MLGITGVSVGWVMIWSTLAAVAVLISPLTQQELPSQSGWIYDQDRDAVTDLQGAIASIRSTDGKALFAIQCDHMTAGRPMLFQIRPGTGRHFTEWFEVTMRPDDRKPFSYYWYWVGEGGVIAKANEIRRIARDLGDADRLIIRALNPNGQPVDMEFQIDKPGAIFDRVAAACGHPGFRSRR